MYCHILCVEVREHFAGASLDVHLVCSMEITQVIRLRGNWLYCLRYLADLSCAVLIEPSIKLFEFNKAQSPPFHNLSISSSYFFNFL